MPKHEYATTCIKCGRPSDAVVCLNCFFEYKHQLYKTEKCESECDCDPFLQSRTQRSDFETDAYPEYRSRFESEYEADSEPVTLDEADEAEFASMWAEEEYVEEPKEPEPPEPPKTPPQPTPPKSVSWFSRLPRF